MALEKSLSLIATRHERLKDTPILFLTENTELLAVEELPVRVDGVIHELNEHQIEDPDRAFHRSAPGSGLF